jgi:DNA modification methylase
MKWIIEKVSKPNDTIFDGFMGSGTTGVACKLLRRNFIGCEIDKNYFELAKKRIDSTEWGLFP